MPHKRKAYHALGKELVRARNKVAAINKKLMNHNLRYGSNEYNKLAEEHLKLKRRLITLYGPDAWTVIGS